MINTYLNDLDAFISANDAVANVDVIRRDIRDTGLEKIALSLIICMTGQLIM